MSERKGRRGPRRAISENEILDAALTLLDEGGPDGASIRGIASRVGVAPNAVYTYFADKATVVKALVDRLLGEVDHDVFADRTQPWRLRVEALALELRQRLAAHPGAISLMIRGPMDGPHALALNERLLELFADTGLSPDAAARAAYLLIVYVFGALALETADVDEPGPLPPEPTRMDTRRRALSATDSDRYPRTAAAATTMAAYITTEQFRWGLHRLLDGIALMTPASARRPTEGARPSAPDHA